MGEGLENGKSPEGYPQEEMVRIATNEEIRVFVP
jgi:hypothetical protein